MKKCIGSIEDQALSVLKDCIDIVMGKQRTSDPIGDVRKLRAKLLKGQTDHLLAVGIASIALDSLETSADRRSQTEPGVVFSKSGAADLAGALSGGNIGKAGGLLGGIIGAVAGGLAASWLVSDDDEDDDDNEVLLFEDVDITQ